MVSKNRRLFGAGLCVGKKELGDGQNKKFSSASRQNKKKEGKEWAGPPRLLLASYLGVLGHLWSQNDVITSWLRLTATSH
jgi:hypothetical protein